MSHPLRPKSRKATDGHGGEWLLASHPPGPDVRRPPLRVPDIPLTLDSTLPEARRPRAAVPELHPLPMRRHVAVADDEILIVDLLAEVLAVENFVVTTALSGAELLDKLAGGPGPDLLITDYMMPGMHGRELARRIREHAPHVKVLYQTGYVDQLFDERMELEPGASFLEKPITPRGLREAARLALFGTLNP